MKIICKKIYKNIIEGLEILRKTVTELIKKNKMKKKKLKKKENVEKNEKIDEIYLENNK